MTEPTLPPSPLPLQKLEANVGTGHVDTILVTFTDMQGRLQGKRVHAKHFLNDVMHHGTEARDYLLAVDVDMEIIPGYEISSWDRGHGDLMLKPDMSTLRAVPWHASTAMVQCDLVWLDGRPVLQSPRQMLRRQVDAAAEHGFQAMASTELEFMVFQETYEQAWDAAYHNLTPVNRYSVDYSIMGTGRVEPLLRDIRNAVHGAGLHVESASGERNHGQHGITIRYSDALNAADQHAVFKLAAKEIAHKHGMSLTFMSKVDERAGNSCHLHMSLQSQEGAAIFVGGPELVAVARRQHTPPRRVELSGRRTEVFRRFLAGVLATLRDFTLLYAPNINSYKRFQPGTLAPTAAAWGEDNRTCALRVAGRGTSLRVENRLPGGDANPYVALAAMLAGGMYGIREGLNPGDALVGNAYASELAPRIPTSLREARDLFDKSGVAREMFTDEVVDHYVRAADVELAAYDRAVTDWERRRGFERL